MHPVLADYMEVWRIKAGGPLERERAARKLSGGGGRRITVRVLTTFDVNVAAVFPDIKAVARLLAASTKPFNH